MKPLPRFASTGSARLVERELPPKPDVTTWLADQEVGIDTTLLHHYCFAQPTRFTYDLMTVVAAVRCVDREFTRSHEDGWSRELFVEIPVFDTALWRDLRTQAKLRQALGYLTGDEWHFTFRARLRHFKPPQERLLDLNAQGRARFMPYSHGLDSFAQLRLLQARDPDIEHVCVYADTRRVSGGWGEFCLRSKHHKVKPIRVPLHFADPHHAEPTFRTRPFIYYMLSAYGAMTAGSSEVVIPENGQGTIGGSLAPLGAEAPHRSCHPGFTSRLSSLFHQLTGHRVRFRHPGLFETKGDVLQALLQVETEGSRWLPQHWSCSRDQRHSSYQHVRVHCGICGNCLLRRNAASVALIDDETQYLYQDFTCSDMAQARLPGSPLPRSHRANEDLASNGARSMQRLADFSSDLDGLPVWTEAANIAEAQSRPIEEVRAELCRFLTRHAQQWSDFLSRCGRNSWLVAMARG